RRSPSRRREAELVCPLRGGAADVTRVRAPSAHQTIARAERILSDRRRKPPEDGLDPRWQAVIKVGEFIETDPEQVWAFATKWGKHPSSDLRAAIATCLVEHLLELHFELVFPR